MSAYAIADSYSKSMLRHTTQKRRNSFYKRTDEAVHSCWWLGVVFSRSQSL